MTKTYVNEVVAEVKALMGEYEVKATDVVKNNNIRMTGIVINNGNNISPTIYVDEMFEKGLEATAAAKEVVRMYNANANVSMNVDDLTDMIRNKERLLANVKPKLVNANQDEELITYPFLDMKVAFYIEIGGLGEGKATVTLKKNNTDVTEAELFKAAIKNIEEPVIMSLGEMLFGMTGENIGTETPMIVVTNESKIFGATEILKSETLAKIAEDFNDDVVILPSSIHEVICVPLSDIDGNPMVGMVRDINRSVVDPKEVLSDNVYIYNRSTNNIEIRKED